MSVTGKTDLTQGISFIASQNKHVLPDSAIEKQRREAFKCFGKRPFLHLLQAHHHCRHLSFPFLSQSLSAL